MVRVYKIKNGKAIGVSDRDKKAADKALKKYNSKKTSSKKKNVSLQSAQDEIRARGAVAYGKALKAEQARKASPTISNQSNSSVPLGPRLNTSGTLTASTPGSSFAMTPPGRFVSGFKEGFNLSPSNPGATRTMSGEYQIGLGVGVATQLGLLVGGGTLIRKGLTKVTKLAKVGTLNTVDDAGRFLVSTGIATNSVTQKATTSLLTKLATGFSNPSIIAGTLMTSVGTYPFSGFVKEEALQTLSFGSTAAIKSGDVEGAESALDLQEEILNPTFTDKVLATIPFVNVVNELKDFFEAAQVKVAIDRQIIEDMKAGLTGINGTGGSSGSTFDLESWRRAQQEQIEQERLLIDYYNQQRRQMLEYERQAKIEARNSDAAFWAKQRELQRQYEAADRKAIAEFWEAYRKRKLELAEENRPSSLNFGLF